MKRNSTIAFLVLALSLPVGAGVAWADSESPLAGTPPVMHQTFWRDGRVEIAPSFSGTLGDTYKSLLMPGLNLTFFPTDWISVGLDFRYGLASDTPLLKQINSELAIKKESVCPAEVLDEEKLTECLDILGVDGTVGTRSLEVLSLASVGLIPIRGKAMFFGHMLRYDLHLLAGLGFATLRGENGLEPETSIAPMAGIGTRWFVADWITLVFQARDILMAYHPATDQNGRELASEFHNHFEVMMGVGFVFPQVPRTDP
jgi:hypothetical protein